MSPPAQSRVIPPRVWVIGAYRAGERSQMLALAEALGWPFEEKLVGHRAIGAPFNLLRGTGLFGLDRESAARLTPPWPDLVISAGMRNEPVGRWIREQSGGRCRLVHVGRPWAQFHNFDLVVATPQYRLPDNGRVLQNALTMHRVTPAHLGRAAEAHGERIARLPAPRIVLVVGGPSGPYAFGQIAARRLARQSSALAAELGGSLLVTTSARTPRTVSETLRRDISVPHEFYEWRRDDPQNPYFAYLAAADRLIVTFDSIAMLSEACATGRPVYMFDLARDRTPGSVAGPGDHDLRSLGYRALMRWGPRRLGRDIALVHERLVREGRAVWLGETHPGTPAPPSDDVARAVARVRELMSQS